MASTVISDLVTPEVWAEYGVKATAESSAFWTSGIVTKIPELTIPDRGGSLNLPYFGDLTGDAEVLSSSALTPANISASNMVAVVIGRGKAWGVNDLAPAISGSDPLRAIISLLGGYWARQFNVELIKTLTGAFAAASMSGLVSDVSAGATEDERTLNFSTFIDACQLLGDAKSNIAAIAMHSATEAYLAKRDNIQYVKESVGSVSVPFYMGKRVIVDDNLPVSTGTYTTYAFAPGAIGFDELPVGKDTLESQRLILAGDDYLTMRKRFVIHPLGVKWTGTPAGNFPDRTELATGTNWARVWDVKQIPIVKILHKNA